MEVHQVDLTEQIHAQQLTADQQATITLQQQDFTQTDINQTTQTTGIQDALVNDAQLQSTLNPQQVNLILLLKFFIDSRYVCYTKQTGPSIVGLEVIKFVILNKLVHQLLDAR